MDMYLLTIHLFTHLSIIESKGKAINVRFSTHRALSGMRSTVVEILVNTPTT